MLLANNQTQQNSNQLSASENAAAAREYLETLAISEQQVKKRSKETIKPEANQDSPFKQKTVNLPAETKHTNQNKKAISEFQNIFSKSSQATKGATQTQISTNDNPQLSDYEIELLSALKKETLYDSFHPVMANKRTNEVRYQIELRLFPNGAIKSARMAKSSGDKDIDTLAIQTAYAASPYPAPPKEDISKRYRYRIPIIYTKEE